MIFYTTSCTWINSYILYRLLHNKHSTPNTVDKKKKIISHNSVSQLCGSSTDLSWAHSSSCIHLIGQLWTELIWACWALNRLNLSMWPFILKEVRPGFFTWLQQHSKSQAPICKHLSTLYFHPICLYPTGQSHIHKPEPLQEDVDTRRCD